MKRESEIFKGRKLVQLVYVLLPLILVSATLLLLDVEAAKSIALATNTAVHDVLRSGAGLR